MTDKIGLCMKEIGYCENCEFKEPRIIQKKAIRPEGVETSYYEVVCAHEKACKRLNEIFEGLSNVRKYWENR